jgi:hypothetical protein
MTTKILINQIILENVINTTDWKISYKKTGKDVKSNSGDDDDGAETIYYDILDSKGKKIGKMEYYDYFSYYSGHMYNKLFKFDGNGANVKSNMDAWMNSNTFKKWASNIDKYKTLKGPSNDYRLKTNKK